nr:lactate racemase domain-containing protein [uncultured Oscillibacter sp.]
MAEKFTDYSKIEPLLADVALPRMFRATQTFPNDHIADPAAETRARLEAAGLLPLIRPGMTVAITGSSRGISNMNVILRETAAFLRRAGARPFIIPAMGSHGGSTAEGQRQILTGYGITEEFCGCPIRSSMETVHLGDVSEDGALLPVYIDRLAYEADGIVVVNRIKPHSAFRGPIESGLTKMMCIGLGKQKGADSLHKDGFGPFATRIPLIGNYVRTHTNVLFGVGTIENAYDQTNRIVVLRNEEIPEREPALLEYAKSLMPRILVPETDVLVVKEIGKNFSGSGMDPNITGTWSTPYGGGGIKKQRTCVLDLTDVSHGNGLGIGQADTTTVRFFNKMDFLATYPNALTSTVFLPVKLAMVLRDDEMAIKAAVKTCNGVAPGRMRVVLIRNTLHMGELYLSEAFWDQARETPGMEIAGECAPLPFDARGNLLLWNEEETI